jgi:hypothetical protein
MFDPRVRADDGPVTGEERALRQAYRAAAAPGSRPTLEDLANLQPIVARAPGPDDPPAERAQWLAFDAMEAAGWHEEYDLVEAALTLDPDNADALRLKASRFDHPERCLEAVRLAVAGGERGRGGPEALARERGRLREHGLARPWMRAKEALV